MQPPNGPRQRGSGHGPPYRNTPGADPRHGFPPDGPGPDYGYQPNGPEPAYGYPPNGPEPAYGYPPHRPEPAYGYPPNRPEPDGYQPGPDARTSGGAAPRPSRPERPRDGSGVRRTALVIQSVADVAAAFLGLWIVLHLLEANPGNPFVSLVQGVAEWLGWWAQDIFTMSNEGVRFFLNYALPAVIYLLVGHGVATWMRRL